VQSLGTGSQDSSSRRLLIGSVKVWLVRERPATTHLSSPDPISIAGVAFEFTTNFVTYPPADWLDAIEL